MAWWVILLIVLGAVAAAIAMPFGRALDLAKTRIGGVSQTVPSPYGTIEFATMGAGPAVLSIHGSGGGFDQGLALGAPLAASGFRILAPSRFGYLRSSFPKDASPMAQADAFAFLLRALGVERVSVLAASAGALSAMQFALRHPGLCAAMALLVPVAFHPAVNDAPRMSRLGRAGLQLLLRSNFLFWAGLKLAPAAMTRSLLATEPDVLRAAPAEEQRRAQATLRNILPIAARRRGTLADRRLAAKLEAFPLEEITVPTLAISCEDDLFGTFPSARHTAQHVRRGSLLAFPSGGHIWAGHNEQVWNEVSAFFGRHLAPGERHGDRPA